MLALHAQLAEKGGDFVFNHSILAIDLDHGTYTWPYQYVAHDVWDSSAVSPPVPQKGMWQFDR